jgi:hypothetical protein
VARISPLFLVFPFIILLLSLELTLAPTTRLLSLLRHISPKARSTFYQTRILSTTTMGKSYPTAPAAPKFTHTVDSIKETAQRLIDDSRAVQDSVGKLPVEEATFENVLTPLARDEDEFGLETYITFYQHVSTDKALRDASSEAEKNIEVREPAAQNSLGVGC